jgi:hypothetical protein
MLPQYLRSFTPGSTFFFTLTRLECRRKLLIENLDKLREVFKVARLIQASTVAFDPAGIT